MTTLQEPKVKLSTKVKPFIFDADQHIYEPKDMWTSRVPSKYKELAPQVVSVPPGGEAWRWEDKYYEFIGLEVGAGRSYTDISSFGHSFADTRPGCYEPRERLKDMDLDGVDKALMFPSQGMRLRNIQDPDLMLALTRAYNEGIVDWCTEGDIERMLPLFALPDVGIEHAIDEFDHWAKQGCRGFFYLGWPSGTGRPQEADDQIWARCQETGIVPCLHGGGPAGGVRGFALTASTDPTRPPHKPGDVIGPGKSTAKGQNLTWLVFSGVFERYPTLKLALVETGSGWLPFFYEQIDNVFYKNRAFEPFNKLSKPPSHYLKEQMWTTIQVDTHAIRNRYDIGVDKLMWSSDYPHSGYGSEFPNSRLFLEFQFRGVPDFELRKMIGLNMNDMLGLPNPTS